MQGHIPLINLNFKLWKIFAIWRDENESRTYKLYRVVFHCFYSVLYIGSIFIGSLATSTVEDFFTGTLFIALTELAMATKTIDAFLNFYTICRLHETAVSPEFQPISEAEIRHSRKLLTKVNIYFSTYLTWVLVAVASNLTFLFNGQYILPFFPWILGVPYGKHLPFNYVILWTYQVSGMAIHAALNVVADTQIGYLLAVAGIQMDFLAERFAELRTGTVSTSEQVKFKKLFRKHIQHFNMVHTFVRDMERIYSKSVFSQFCASGMTICAIAYKLSSVNFAEEYLAAIPTTLYLFSMMNQIFLPCYFGNEVTLKSERLTHALFSSKWYTMALQNQKDVKMLMVRSVRPTALKAGGFFYYNLSAFTSTLNTAYSLFCVLQRRSQIARNN